jgi:pyruvate dehydrogenase E2 component (dihydrolipoamide acetyltransferase)
MSDLKQFRLPDVGEGLTEAEIVSWKVQPGDPIKVNDVLVEIETAKSLVELPSPFAGTVADLLVAEGDTVLVGAPIIAVETGTGAVAAAAGEAEPDAGTTEPAPSSEPASPAAGGRQAVLVGYGPLTTSGKRRARKQAGSSSGGAAAVSHEALNQAFATAPEEPDPDVPAGDDVEDAVSATPEEAVPATPAAPAPADGNRPLAKPPVRKLAKDLGVDLAEVTPTGPQGVITRSDVEAFAGGGAEAAPVSAPERTSGAPAERETRVPVKGVRKMTAQAMVGSAFSAPHVTEWVTLDATRTMRFVDRLRVHREFTGVKVSPLLVAAKAVCLAVRRTPEVNATWDEQAQEIVLKRYVNLGIAAATPRGLVVPNVKDADQLSLRELAGALGELTATAREGKAQPADMAGGSFTITNVGVFGVDAGTPILNPGESAILCMGAIRRQPWVHAGKVKPRWVTTLAVSFDHRVVDGAQGSQFLADVAAILEDPGAALLH